MTLTPTVSPALTGSLALGTSSLTPTGSTTLTLRVGRKAAPGSYTVTVTATGGGLSHSGTATVVVQ